MNVDELRQAIRKKHGQDLVLFRSKWLGPEGRTDADNSSNPLERTIPGMSARSVTDRFVDITMIGDMAATGWLWVDAELTGSCATVSFAAHHRQLGTRVSLPSGECDAWAAEIAGDGWARHLYRAGTLSGPNRLSTVYYRVFLDDDGAPTKSLTRSKTLSCGTSASCRKRQLGSSRQKAR